MNVYKVNQINPQGRNSSAPQVHIELDAYEAEILHRHLSRLDPDYSSDQVVDLTDDLCIVLNDPDVHAERMRQTREVDSDFEGENPPELPDWYKKVG
jgi:hypothetical protein